MKTQILLLILIFVSCSLFSQTEVVAPVTEPTDEMISEPVDTIFDELYDETPVEGDIDENLGGELQDPEKTDTVHIRVGKHAIEIVTNDKKTHIDVDKLDDFESQWEDRDWKRRERIETRHHRKNKKFDGHWSGIDFGGNLLLNPVYPEGAPAFLATAPEKSFETNINLFEYSFGFSPYFGIVTGLGVNLNDYKFKNRYTLTKDENDVIQPLALPEGDFRLSKLSTTFITAPLLLEVQIPGQFDHKRIFIAAGVIGGVKIHEHIKTQIGEEKKRDNGDYNIAPIRWGYTARVGFENMGVFATYYNTKLFETGMGPDTTPVTIGLTFTF
jgi:hypothetical protein